MTEKYPRKGVLAPRQQRALSALLTHPTKEAAAAAAGITSKTLRGYLADPLFQAEYKKAFGGLVEDAARQARQALSPALSTLREIAADGNETAQVRISAARSVLEYGLRLTEQADIAAKLQELEAELMARPGGGW